MLIIAFLVLFAGAVPSINAQDFIYLNDGNTIEATIMELSPAGVKYRSYENSVDPVDFIQAVKITSVKYRTGEEYKIYDTYIERIDRKTRVDGKTYKKSRYNNNEKMIIGINANAGGAIPLGDTLTPSGPSVNVEFIKGNFYSFINLSVPYKPSWGFGFLGNFNYLWNTKIGDFYLGGGLGYEYLENHFFTFGANVGYRYVMSFGMYLGAGAYVGGKISKDDPKLDIRPILGIGYVF